MPSNHDAAFNRDAARHVATNAVNRGAPSNCDAVFNRDAARHVATNGDHLIRSLFLRSLAASSKLA